RSPSINAFIDGIKLEQSYTETIQVQLATGRVPKRRPAYVELDNRIKTNLLILSDRKGFKKPPGVQVLIDVEIHFLYTSAALSSEAATGFGGFVQSSSNTENGFGTLAAQNQSGSLFSSFTTNSGAGFSNNSSFTSYRK
ncbi:hypothetical protein BpHYR1_005019, partial [Brachionus plicatilis]